MSLSSNISDMISKAGKIFSKEGLEAINKNNDGTLTFLNKLKKQYNALNDFKQNFVSADAATRRKIFKDTMDVDSSLYNEMINSVEYKHSVLDEVIPNHGLIAPTAPSKPRGATNGKNKNSNNNQWTQYDKDYEEYVKNVNEYYEAALKEDSFKGEIDRINQDYLNNTFPNTSGARDTVTSGGPEPLRGPEGNNSWTSPNPDSSTPNAGAGQRDNINPDSIPEQQLPDIYNPSNTLPSTGNMPNIEISNETRKAFAIDKLKKTLQEKRRQREVNDEIIRTEKGNKGFFGRLFSNIGDFITGNGESTKWMRGRNTRKAYYSSLNDAFNETILRKDGFNGNSTFSYNWFTGKFRSDGFDSVYQKAISDFAEIGGKGGRKIKGAMPSYKEMVDDPDKLAQMLSGKYFEQKGTLDGITDWTKNHQLIVAGAIAAAGVGAGALLVNKDDRGY